MSDLKELLMVKRNKGNYHELHFIQYFGKNLPITFSLFLFLLLLLNNVQNIFTQLHLITAQIVESSCSKILKKYKNTVSRNKKQKKILYLGSYLEDLNKKR